MLHEQTRQVARPDSESAGELTHRVRVEEASVDHAHAPRHGRPCAAPGRTALGCFGPAAQAGTKALSLSRCRGRHEEHIPGTGMDTRTDRAAVDPRRADAGEEHAVVRGVVRASGAITSSAVTPGVAVRRLLHA